jgi:hypothetical protein
MATAKGTKVPFKSLLSNLGDIFIKEGSKGNLDSKGNLVSLSRKEGSKGNLGSLFV